MSDLNQVMLLGRLTDNPELKQKSNGEFVCRFTIACNRIKNKDGIENTDFINIVAWRKKAEFVSKYFVKGKPILVKGAIRSGSYNDQNGKKVYYTDVVADEVFFAGETKAEQKKYASNKESDVDSSEFEEIIS